VIKSPVLKFIGRSLIMVAIATLLVGCPKTKEQKGLAETLEQYAIIIRWAQWDAAVDYVSMEYQVEHPITRLELDRLRLFRVTQYIIRSSIPIDEGKGMVQIVEVRMFNKNQARERSIIDEQLWKFNEETERWQLHSGLPDPTQKNY
jgi:hypothetical protein